MRDPTKQRLRSTVAILGALCLVPGCDVQEVPRGARVDTVAGELVVTHNPERAGQDASLQAREVLRLGSLEGGPTEFGSVDDLAIQPETGHLFVLDGQASEVRVFDTEGTHVRTFGAPGEGPGELQSPAAISFGPDGLLWVVDLGNGRYVRFTADGSHAGSSRREVVGRVRHLCCGFDQRGRVIDAGVGLGADRVTYRALFRLDSTGRLSDTLRLPQVPVEEAHFDLEGGPGIVRIPWTPSYAYGLAPNGDVWVALSSEYRVVRWTPEGDSVRVVTRETERPPVSDAETGRVTDRLVELTEGAVRGQLDRIPDRKPFIRDLHVDGRGRLWVRRYVAAPEGEGLTRHSRFDVFGADGVYRYSVFVDERLQPPVVIADGRLYAATDDGGVPTIVSFDADSLRLGR